MAITLADNALTTMSSAKSYLGNGACGGSQLASLISQASTLIESATDRSLGIQTVTGEKVRGFGCFGSFRLMVTRTPLKSITAIRLKDCDLDLTNVTIEDAGAGSIIQPGGWVYTGHRANDISRGPLPGTELLDYEVDYVGGYILPKDSGDASPPINGDPSDLPADLELAALELVRSIQAVKARDPGVVNEKLLSWSATYATGSGGVMDNSMVQTIVTKYARCWPS